MKAIAIRRLPARPTPAGGMLPRRLLVLPPQGYTSEQAQSLETPDAPPPALVEALAAIIRRIALEELGAYDTPTES